MKKISILIVSILALAGCSKLEVYEANLPGTWSPVHRKSGCIYQ
ncbi:MAG: lipoprotein [Candidatus Cryptobacteroides sp.]